MRASPTGVEFGEKSRQLHRWASHAHLVAPCAAEFRRCLALVASQWDELERLVPRTAETFAVVCSPVVVS